MTKPYGLLRAGYPFYATLGMRRVTTYPMDVVIGGDRDLYTLNRSDGAGGEIRLTNWDDDDLGTIGSDFVWPVQMIAGPEDTLVVSDEGSHTITFWAKDGTKKDSWGEHGAGEGQLNRPSGIAFDSEENLLVVDTMNHRVQKFNAGGQFISSFGSLGDSNGEFNMPWGIAIDSDDGSIFIGDWRNDRVQKFTSDGDFVLSFGNSGNDRGELNRPAGIALDAHGDIYVADRGNHRVQQFNRDGNFVDIFIGDAGLSKSGRIYIMANPKVLRAREMTHLVDAKRLRGPASVRIDGELMYIPDFGSHRIQVYRKEAYELTEEQIYEEPNAPFLYTV